MHFGVIVDAQDAGVPFPLPDCGATDLGPVILTGKLVHRIQRLHTWR